MTRHSNGSKVSKARIVRAVASSSAIEIGKNVKAIEAKLKTHQQKYAGLQLALTSSSSV